MDDYISREAAIAELCRHFDNTDVKLFYPGVNNAVSFWLNSVPAADVRPVVRGEWLGDERECSNCERSLSELTDAWSYFGAGIDDVIFCPFCGAYTGGHNVKELTETIGYADQDTLEPAT